MSNNRNEYRQTESLAQIKTEAFFKKRQFFAKGKERPEEAPFTLLQKKEFLKKLVVKSWNSFK